MNTTLSRKIGSIAAFAWMAIAAVAPTALSQTAHSQDQGPSKTRAHVSALAAQEFGGRLTGTDGERQARDYLVSQLKRIGAKPLPGRSDFLQPFEFTAGTRDGGSRIKLEGSRSSGKSFDTANNIRALSFSDNGDVTGPVVFAGYGIVVPEAQGFAYDSYATLDVKDKIVVVLRYFPEEAEEKTKAILARYSDLRYKAMAARQRGAKALLVVSGPSSPNAGETIPMFFDTAIAGSGIVAASISGAVADTLFGSMNDPGKTLIAAQKSLDDANPHATGFALPNVALDIHVEVVREKRTGFNVIGYLPATQNSPASKPSSKSWLAVGAHYDHLGHGESGNSLADKSQAGQVHAGADDNASGSAAVLAVGEALKTQSRARHVMLAFWSGEELGLIGSSAYVNKPIVPIEQLAAYVNFDMVGRMRENKLTVQAVGSSPQWPRLLEQANVAAGFQLLAQNDPYQPTDSSSFNQAGVPTLNFFTGSHIDYHRPSDTADKINYEDLDRVTEFATSIIARILRTADAPQFTKVEQSSDTASRTGIRLFTGTIPDYSTEVKGLLLSGVVGGGPAEQSGLQKGDVIVEIAGKTIANIYDYTYALEVLKIGVPTKVIYLRNGERRETTLTPAARK